MLKLFIVLLGLAHLHSKGLAQSDLSNECLRSNSICNPNEIPRSIAGFNEYQETDALGLDESGEQRTLQSNATSALNLYIGTLWRPHPFYPLDPKKAELLSKVGLRVSLSAKKDKD